MQILNFLAFIFDKTNRIEKSDIVFLWFVGLFCVIVVCTAIVKLKPPKDKKN